MSTFKTALRMALAHPLYLLIYTVFISLMGVFIAASVSWNSSQLTEYKPYDANVIVVDRDDSDLSRALTKHLVRALSWSRASATTPTTLRTRSPRATAPRAVPTACSLSRRGLRTTSLRPPARGSLCPSSM